jgi:hypothetical protein
MSSMTRCASTSCTFANMNTQTDVDRFSSIQVQYCADKGLMPSGMTLPSSVEAVPTATDETFATGTTVFTSLGATASTGQGTSSITRPTTTRGMRDVISSLLSLLP